MFARLARLSTGHVVMLGAGALGVLLTLNALHRADATHPVLVVAHDVASGTIVGDADLRVARVRASGVVLSDVFQARDRPQVLGQAFATTMRAGALVMHASVERRDAHNTARVMSFPLPRARAVGGKLATGDRVDVIAVGRDNKQAAYILADAEVVAVDTQGAGPLSSASEDVSVSVVVDAESAARLAAALDAGTVTLVRHG